MDAIKKPENWCAVAMICFFFLPWAQLLGINGSGYELSKFGSHGNWAWAIPLAAGLTLVISLAGHDAKPLHVVTGLLPYAGVAYGLSQVGKDLFHILAIGVYLTLAAGLLMILFATGVLGANVSSTIGEGTQGEAAPDPSSPPHTTTKHNKLPAFIVIGIALLAALGFGVNSFVKEQRERERIAAEKLAQEEYARQQQAEQIRRQQEWQRQQQFEQARRQEQIERQQRTEEDRKLFQIGQDAYLRKQYEDALPPLRKSAERGYALAQNSLAWLYATSPDSRYLDPANAVRFAEFAVQQEPNNWSYIDTLAAAYARSGNFTRAVQTQDQAINLLRENYQMSGGDRERALEGAKQRRALYSARQAFTE